jgi:uncharacterized protein YbjT (DUF2867 family)
VYLTYTDPEVAHVGLDETEAKARGIDVRTFTEPMARVDRAVLDGDNGISIGAFIMTKSQSPILVTGAAGRIGGVGGEVVDILRGKDLPVRALVRTDDDRAEALRAKGVEVVVGDLTRTEDFARALDGCRRLYFGMSVSAPYLEATVTAAAVARELGGLEAFVNISQLTVSQMSLLAMTDSLQQRMHWLGEQALNWSGLPVIHVRATVFLQHFFFSQWAAESIAKDGTIRLPFGNARTSPIDTRDVAEVIAAVLERPEAHVGQVIELTGPKSEDMWAVAAEYSEALGRWIWK